MIKINKLTIIKIKIRKIKKATRSIMKHRKNIEV